MDALEALRLMMLIRAFETALAKLPDHGFQLLSAGEEAVAVGISKALTSKDQLLSGGRSIGPALALGADPGAVMAELLGRVTGLNGGRGGRGHMADPASGFFGAHAVVAGNISIAAGVALAKKMAGDGGIVSVLFGDGACGAGTLHETLNISALWRLPLLFICNNNQLAVSTERTAALAPAKLSDLGATFGMWTRTVDGLDVACVAAAATEAAQHVRQGHGPAFLECVSVRLMSHSTTARETRSRATLTELRTRCPIRRQVASLQRLGLLDTSQVEAMEQQAADRVSEAIAFASASPYPEASDVLDHVD
jgi:TPP-dependent pyruvate/acetoin dehydrogenase alpha subunit